MVLKTKLSLGLGFLFLIIFALAVFCSYFVGKLAQDADNILKDNYHSIVYSRNMLYSLDDMRTALGGVLFHPQGTGRISGHYLQLFDVERKSFEANLELENKNITEVQEKEYVQRLNQDYEMFVKLCLQLRSELGGTPAYFNDFLPASERLKQDINAIYELNMQAVVRRNDLVKQDSRYFITYMAAIGAFCLILAFGYFWYFPFYISATFSYLSVRMKELLGKAGLGSKIKTNDEGQVILQAINLLEEKLILRKIGKKS